MMYTAKRKIGERNESVQGKVRLTASEIRSLFLALICPCHKKDTKVMKEGGNTEWRRKKRICAEYEGGSESPLWTNKTGMEEITGLSRSEVLRWYR